MSVEIRVYPNRLDKSDCEINTADAGQTFKNWLLDNVPAYYQREAPLFSVLINGDYVAEENWGDHALTDGDLVECTVEPKGAEVIIMTVIAVASAAYAIHMANQPIPDSYNATSPKGSPIYDVNAKANKPRLMGVVPVLFGTHEVIPSYLNPPRVEYVDNKQVYYAMLAVCSGKCDLDSSRVFLADTAFTSFNSADAEAVIFEPGADVTGHPAHQHVYASPEVGGVDGASGLRIQGPLSQLKSSKWRVMSENQLIWDPQYSPPNPQNPDQDDDYWYGRDFTQFYNDSPHPDNKPLEGRIFRFNGDRYGYYRLVEMSTVYPPQAPNRSLYIGTFQKLDEDRDFQDSTTWIGPTGNGFGSVGDEFDTDFIIFDKGAEIDGAGEFRATPDGGTTKKINLGFRFDQGLCVIDNDGNPQERSVELEITIWLNNVASTQRLTFTASTVDQQAFYRSFAVPDGSVPYVQVRRITDEYDDIKYKDAVTWSLMNCDLESAASYPFTTLAVKITGSSTIAAGSNNRIRCIPTGIHKTFDNTGNLVEKPTNDIAAALIKVADDAGHTIDMIGLRALHEKWKVRGDTFAGVYDNPTTVWKAWKQQADVGFAEPTLDFGEVVFVRDELRTYDSFMYTPENTLENSWSCKGTFFNDSDSDGIEIEWMDTETWKPKTRVCTLPGHDGLRPEQVRLFGVVNELQAYRIAMRKLAVQQYRRVQHHFSTETDALNSRYMSKDVLSIAIPGYGQSGVIEAVNGRAVVTSVDLDWGGVGHHISIRRPDGTKSGPYQASRGASDNEVLLNKDLDFTPVFGGNHEPPHFIFGDSEESSVPILVKDIKPTGTDKVKVTAFKDDPRCYQYDDALLPS